MALFTPPDTSVALCENVPFDTASDTAIDNKAAFDAFDQTPEGENDPSRCKALLAFPDGTGSSDVGFVRRKVSEISN